MKAHRELVRWLPLLIAATFLACASAEQQGRSSEEAADATADSAAAMEPAEAMGEVDTADESEEMAPAGEATGEEAMPSAAQGSGSGIEGRVTIGPACPAQEIGRECPSQPYETELLIRDAETGEVIERVRSDAEGRFRLELPPGSYSVAPPPRQLVSEPQAEPVPVTVQANEWVVVRIAFDSGAR